MMPIPLVFGVATTGGVYQFVRPGTGYPAGSSKASEGLGGEKSGLRDAGPASVACKTNRIVVSSH